MRGNDGRAPVGDADDFTWLITTVQKICRVELIVCFALPHGAGNKDIRQHNNGW